VSNTFKLLFKIELVPKQIIQCHYLMYYNSKHHFLNYRGLTLQNKTTIIKREVKGPNKKNHSPICIFYFSFSQYLVILRHSFIIWFASLSLFTLWTNYMFFISFPLRYVSFACRMLRHITTCSFNAPFLL
jgi:hypothetical protein